MARDRATAVMCAEAVWWRCHRRLIADALPIRGWRAGHLGIGEGRVGHLGIGEGRVGHLGIGEGRAVHALTEFAVVGPNRIPVYPPAQGRLPGWRPPVRMM